MITAQDAGGSGGTSLLITLALMAALFYFLIIRPSRNRQRQAMQVQGQVEPGVEVMLTSGLFGTVLAVEDDVVILEVAPGVTNRYTRQAVMRVITPEEEPEAQPELESELGPEPIDRPDEKP